MIEAPEGRRRKLTDQELREELAAGQNYSAIARKYGVSPQAISQRAKNLDVGTIAASVAPQEARRFVAKSINAMEEVSRSLSKVSLLMDACDEWLRDPDDPEKYNLNPRSSEVDVTYEVELTRDDGTPYYQKRKKTFSELCYCLKDGDETVTDDDGGRFVGVVKGEYKVADPRELILKTAQETRATILAAAELVDRVYNARAVEAFRQAMLNEISKVDPDVAQRIAEAVQRSILLCNASGEFSSLPECGIGPS